MITFSLKMSLMRWFNVLWQLRRKLLSDSVLQISYLSPVHAAPQ